MVITEPVGHPLDDLALVVDALEHAGVQRITAMRQQRIYYGVNVFSLGSTFSSGAYSTRS